MTARSISQTIGSTFVAALATMALGNMQEMENELYLAAETQRQALQLFGDPPLPIAHESHRCLARILYEWNDLDSAQYHGEKSVRLARQHDDIVDRYVICEVFLAHLKLAQGDAVGAAAMLAETSRSVRQHDFVHRIPEVAAEQVIVLLHQGNLAAAAQLAQAHELPISRARVHLAQGNPSAAVEVLEPLRRQMEAKGWQDERLKVMVLQAVALHAHGEKEKAVQLLGDALALAEPGGFIRLFVDEGMPMKHLLQEVVSGGIAPDYTRRLLAAFSPGGAKRATQSAMVEALSEREIEVLQHIAKGSTNQQIADRLYLSLNTVKVHTRNIFGKLGVNHRTEAVARARELGLLSSS